VRKIFKYIKIFLRIFYWIVYFLSGFFPRDKSIWVFGSLNGKRFADNPKYLFLDLVFNEQGSDIKPIWITRDKKVLNYLKQQNLPVYFLYSFKGIYYCLRGKVWIYDHKSNDICYWLSNGVVKINLWHGIPLKRIEWDSKILEYFNCGILMKILIYIFSPWNYEKPNFVLSPTSITDKIFTSAFRVNENNIVKVSYPRVKAILYPEKFNFKTKKVMTLQKCKLYSNKKIILYTPTFRNLFEEKITQVLDFDILSDYLLRNNLIMLIKFHPNSKLNNVIKNSSFKNIYILDKFEDVYEYLFITDILITDYSSIFFDFLYLDRPIIFFPYDLETYIKRERELYFNFNEYTPGPKVFSMKELLNNIDLFIKNQEKNDEYKLIRKNFIEKIKVRYNFNILNTLKIKI